jgi:hypothetical protein
LANFVKIVTPLRTEPVEGIVAENFPLNAPLSAVSAAGSNEQHQLAIRYGSQEALY